MSDTPLVPSFGDEPKVPSFGDAPTTPSFGEANPTPYFGEAPSTAAPGGKRKLCIICSKGNLDMAYPGLILANSAIGEGIETHLFFTFWGLDIITKGRMENLKFTLMGNTAMHPEQAPSMSMPQIMGIMPGMTGMATKMMKKQIADLDIPEIPEMLDLISAGGGKMWACRMSFDMMKLRESQLYDGVGAVISATDFMELSDGAQIIFI